MRANRPGFASVTAIVLIGLVSMTLAAMCVTLVSDARRTRAFADDAQLRQLLLAGAQIAQSRLATSPPAGPVSVSLLDSLRQQGATLSLEFRGGESADEEIVQIDAKLPNRRMSQEVHFARRDNAWEMTSASLQ